MLTIFKEIKGLNFEDEHPLYINDDVILPLKKELETFLKTEKEMNTLKFSKKVMQSQEIKTNNDIEGYLDDVSLIEDVIRDSNQIINEDTKNRIINMYQGYKYILQKPAINKETLKNLYRLLSSELLCDYDISHMGKYYREDDVLIYFSSNFAVPPEKGINYEKIDDMMDSYFNYLNSEDNLETMTDFYIKSQIAHFYFVYVHPYFDINGRTARTTSMWYLLNNEAYPYVIFNRAIGNSKNTYYKEIRKAKTNYNLTNFIEYLMINVKKELEKEYVVQAIKASTNEKLSSIEFYAILDILSMKGLKTLKDFASFYNLKNDKKRVSDIYLEMIEPLLDKGVIVKTRKSNSLYNDKDNNFLFELNESKLDLDSSKIRRLFLK